MKKATRRKAAKVTKARDPVAAFEALSDAEKEKVYQSVDREIAPEELRPLTAAERRQHERWRNKGGRPRVGKGSQVVTVSLEKSLLADFDAFAKEHGFGRSEMVTAGLIAVMQLPEIIKLAAVAKTIAAGGGKGTPSLRKALLGLRAPTPLNDAVNAYVEQAQTLAKSA